MTNFKANLLQSNQQGENESINVIVDEIWNLYDIDNSGTLDRDETRKFVQEYIPDMKNEWEFDELAFGRLFTDVDKDKTGQIKRHEMSEFLRRILYDEDKKNPAGLPGVPINEKVEEVNNGWF